MYVPTKRNGQGKDPSRSHRYKNGDIISRYCLQQQVLLHRSLLQPYDVAF